MIKLVCDDGCKREFLLMRVGTETVRDDIQKVGFTCPWCGKEYISHYTNSGIRAMQEMQKELMGKPKTKKTNRLIKDLKKRIKVGMDRLKKEVEMS